MHSFIPTSYNSLKDKTLVDYVDFLYYRFEGHMECPPGMSHPSFSVNHSILEAVRPRLKDFHQLLLEPPKVKKNRTETAVGIFKSSVS